MTVTPVAKHPMALRKSLGARLIAAENPFSKKTLPGGRGSGLPGHRLHLPRKTQRKLNLTRVEDGSRRTIARVGRCFTEKLSDARAARCYDIERAKISRPVHRVKEAHVHRVEKVESLRNSLDVEALGNREFPGDTQVHTLVAVALKSIPRFQANAIIVAEHVAVHVRPGEFGEVVRRLQADDGREFPVIDQKLLLRRTSQDCIGHKSVRRVIRRYSTLAIEMQAVLRNQHEAGIRPVVNTLRPRVT